MRKYFLFFFILMVTGQLSAQYAPAYPMIEHFTNTRCILCPPLNATFYSTIDANSTFVHQVSYHPPVPYPLDTFYRENPLPQNTRRQFYGVTGTPRAFFEGSDVRQGQELVPASIITNAKGKRTGLELQVDEVLVQGNMQALVTVRTLNADSLKNFGALRLFVILVEDSVEYMAPNGEDLHHNIFRESFTSIEGQEFTTPIQGAAIPFNFSYQIKNHWDSTQLHVLAFVFDENGNFVNSGSRDDLRISTSSTASSNQNDGTATVVAQRGTPPYSYQWNDPNNQTSSVATGLNAGDYLVTVTDSLGVSIQEQVSVQSQVANEERILLDGSIYLNQRQLNLINFPEGKLEVSIFDLQGRKVSKYFLNSKRNFELNELNKGLYILKVEANNAIWQGKFILN
ncbi:MAG: Omp28-related outer membrane protein [Bacteroidia bacterium]|nr:Omp28-related outer membrane protein [Bacteroidia bacterium]